ncbi:MAG: TIGR04283 family arsenosugar biosynthesis glycosyltransferase [Gemmatimonadota bacterium]
MPSIAVVIPTLNEALALETALQAIGAQLRAGDELWVVDAGSRDATVTIAARHARLIEGAPPRGRQLNDGARRAATDALLFLHADCVLPPGGLDEVRAALADPGVAGGCFRIRFSPGEIARAPLLRAVASGINFRTRALRQGTGDQGVFARATAFHAGGGVPDWPLMEDLELCRRLKRFGRFRVLGPPLQTSARRWLRRGVVRTQLTMWGFRLAHAFGVSPAALGRRYAAIR